MRNGMQQCAPFTESPGWQPRETAPLTSVRNCRSLSLYWMCRNFPSTTDFLTMRRSSPSSPRALVLLVLLMLLACARCVGSTFTHEQVEEFLSHLRANDDTIIPVGFGVDDMSVDNIIVPANVEGCTLDKL